MTAATVVAAVATAAVDGNNRGATHGVGNGGVETVTADPIFSDGGAPVEAAPAEPVTGGTYGPVARATAKIRSSTSSTRPPTTTASHATTCCG